MTLHPCYVRHKPQRMRFQPQNIDIYAQMPDIEKIKINAKTAVLAFVGTMASVFLAGGWFFGVRYMQTDISDMKQILIKMAEHDIGADNRILSLEKDVKMLQDNARAQRGPQP